MELLKRQPSSRPATSSTAPARCSSWAGELGGAAQILDAIFDLPREEIVEARPGGAR